MTQQPGTTYRPGDLRYRQGKHAAEHSSSSPTIVFDATHDFDPIPETTTTPTYEPRATETPVAVRIVSRIRFAPILAGFLIGFTTWMVLELALFALNLSALAAKVADTDGSAWWWSGAAATLAFLLGGVVAGASISSRRAMDGVLHGITVWSLTVFALIVLSAAGAGIGFGVVGDILTTSPSLPDARASVINDAQTAAAAALLALAVTLAAAAIGGAIGAKIWPPDDDLIDVRDRSIR
jgi:hypothetical protein